MSATIANYQALALEKLTTDFEEVKKAFREKLGFDFKTKIGLGQYPRPNAQNFVAAAWNDSKADEVIFNINRLNIYDNRQAIVHELVHGLQFQYKAFKVPADEMFPHSFDFAITSAFCKHTLGYQKKWFFDQYDMYEDVAFPSLLVKPAQYDYLICQEDFKDMDSLITRSHQIARGMRRIAERTYDEI